MCRHFAKGYCQLGDACGFSHDESKVLEGGDWFCSGCGDYQFARNSHCRQCGAEKQAGVGLPPGTKPEDLKGISKGCKVGKGSKVSKGGKGGSGDDEMQNIL